MTSYLKQKQLDIEVEVSIEDAVDEVIYVRSNICASDGVIRIRVSIESYESLSLNTNGSKLSSLLAQQFYPLK